MTTNKNMIDALLLKQRALESLIREVDDQELVLIYFDEMEILTKKISYFVKRAKEDGEVYGTQLSTVH